MVDRKELQNDVDVFINAMNDNIAPAILGPDTDFCIDWVAGHRNLYIVWEWPGKHLGSGKVIRFNEESETEEEILNRMKGYLIDLVVMLTDLK